MKFHYLNPVQRQQTQTMYADNKFSTPPCDGDGYDYELDENGNVKCRTQLAAPPTTQDDPCPGGCGQRVRACICANLEHIEQREQQRK